MSNRVEKQHEEAVACVSAAWSRVRLGDICEIVRGVSYKKEQASEQPANGFVPILRATNIQDGALVLDSDLVYVPSEVVSAEQMLRLGDIVVATSSGSKHLVGKTAQVNESWPGSFGAFCAALRPKAEIDYRYLGYFFGSQEYKDYIRKKALGVNINNLRRGDLEEISVPLAPHDQQKRIVAEIEKQFSRLDEAVANLKRVEANLKRYKAAVLKAAVEGRLVETEAEVARREGRRYETGEQLLQRILKERRQKWEKTELAKMKAKGKPPRDDKWKRKYKEPAGPDTTDLPDLPEGWVWATAEQVSHFITKGTTPTASKLSEGAGEVQFLKVYNLTFDGSLNYMYKPTFVSRETHEGELARSKVLAGDVLINIVGPPLGQVSVVPLTLPEANINQAIARFRPVKPLGSGFLSLMLLSEGVMRWAIRRAKTTAGQSNLTLELCRCLPIPRPPVAEQEPIVTEVERRLSLIREVEGLVEANVLRAGHLVQSIRQCAFNGDLKRPVVRNAVASAFLEKELGAEAR